MLAGSLELKEPWYITGAEFDCVKNVIDVYVGIREDAVIACRAIMATCRLPVLSLLCTLPKTESPL